MLLVGPAVFRESMKYQRITHAVPFHCLCRKHFTLFTRTHLICRSIMSPSTFGSTVRAKSLVCTSQVMNLLETLTTYLKSIRQVLLICHKISDMSLIHFAIVVCFLSLEILLVEFVFDQPKK